MPESIEIFNDLLRLAVESGASDIVVKSGNQGYLRIAGRLKSVDMDPITADEVGTFVESFAPDVFRGDWMKLGQVDFAYIAPDIGRFRVNAFYQRGTPSLVFRYIKERIPTGEELNLPMDSLTRFAKARDGIVLVCGPTGSGKSCTLAAMLNWINRTLARHIVTLEDPIEYTFVDDRSIFQQREIGLDVLDFGSGIKAVLRQNPDIILIGEMRDRESFETAMSAAETGHLVLSTMHAATVSQALTRLMEFFPSARMAQIRRQLSVTLRGIVCQQLLPALEGGGRIPALEILNADATVRDLILDGKNEGVQRLLDENVDSLSFSFNRDLLRLVQTGRISKGDALAFSPNPQALEMNFKGIFHQN